MTGLSLLALYAGLLGGLQQPAAVTDLRGGWALDTYLLKDGTRRPLAGRLVFTDREWLVLYFITERDVPQRGSAEGGTYTLSGDRLVFTHLFNMTGERPVGGGAEASLKMELHEQSRAPAEPCRIVVDGERLTIQFLPSGNSILLRRSSGR